jgi:hypothetical protein
MRESIVHDKEGKVEKFNPSKFQACGWQKYRDSSTKPLTPAFSKLIGKYRTERLAMLKDITGATTVILPHITEILETLKSDKDPDRILVDKIVTTPQVSTKKKAPPPQPTVLIMATDSATNSPGKIMATTRQEYRSLQARTDQHSVIDMQSIDKQGGMIATADTNRIAEAVVSQVLEKLSQTSLAADGTILRPRDTGIIGREVETRPSACNNKTNSVINPRIVKQPPTVHQRYRFTDITKFAQFITAFNNYVASQQMGYLLDKQFQVLYENARQ